MILLNTLKRGSRGPQTELLQLALKRAGYDTGEIDGIFGEETCRALKKFQRETRVTASGTANAATWRNLTPFLTGYTTYTIKKNDSLYKIASHFGTTVKAIETANPGFDPFNMHAVRRIIIPLGFEVVPDNISFTSTVLEYCVEGLRARYPFISTGALGRSVMLRKIYVFRMGSGKNNVFYNASHHANEWITTPLLLKFLETYAYCYSHGLELYGVPAKELHNLTTLHMIPMVNPDGADLVTGDLYKGSHYEKAKLMAEEYPDIPFPSGWKGNINGIDLNLQYPAGWDNAKKIKFDAGFDKPGPRDFVGGFPLEAPESKILYNYTNGNDFRLTLSYHTQGEVIYWKYLDYCPKGSHEIARKFSEVSGYSVEETPDVSGFAGFKDWFIEKYSRPSYTIEAGMGSSPLPISDFDKIYENNREILSLGLTVTSN